MEIRPNREWSSWSWSWAWAWAGMRPALPLVILIAVTITRVLEGPAHGVVALLAVAPAAAGALGGPLYTLAIGAAAVGAEAVVTKGLREEAPTRELVRVALFVIVGVCVGGVAASYLRRCRDRELTEVRGVAAAAQQALLRPIPSRAGPVRLSAKYTSASSQADVGGDLYAAAVTTANGLRLIVGDAAGKGLPAVHMAAAAMFAFRLAAHTESELSVVAARVEAALVHELDQEQFITAVLAEISQDFRELTVLNCGHPHPLLLGQNGPELLGPEDNGLPLGLGPLAADQREPFTIAWEAGDPVLFYTDGLIEARGATGAFFPLTECVSISGRPNPETLLERLSAEVSSYANHKQQDDMALLLTWRQGSGGARVSRTSSRSHKPREMPRIGT